MNEPLTKLHSPLGRPVASQDGRGFVAARLLHLVDIGLIATICGAPFVFGGRHDLGRLVFVATVALTAIAWFTRQSLLPNARWTRTAANWILLLAVLLVGVQIVPLPASWIARISPRTAELLPLWTPGGEVPLMGVWKTLSFAPVDTTLGLAMLAAYGLLFIVVVQRIGNLNDVRRMLSWVAVAAVLMAAFGLIQFFTSNGRYFWFYDHPHRSTDHVACGSFMNRNHFAHFLVLGVGPLIAWLMATWQSSAVRTSRYQGNGISSHLPALALAASLLMVVLAAALSQSRGGAVALMVAVVTLSVIYWRWRLVDARYLFGLAAVGVALLGVLSIYGYEKVAARLDDLTDGSLEAVDRDAGRREVWSANVDAIRSGGLTGAGVGSHMELSPLYLERPSDRHSTHAENGYLQIATETGWLGVALLAAGIGLCGGWCVACWRRLRVPAEQICFGATAAGLAASLAHSVVDFVWYIPATMSVTLVLAACTLRLSQFALPEARREEVQPVLRRPRWLELTAATTLAGIWAVYVYVAPALASLPWDRYLNVELAHSQLARRISAARIAGTEPPDASSRPHLVESMVRHLEETLDWNPQFALAHFELAQRSLDLFELRQQDGANAMGVVQIAEAAAASQFETEGELQAWLGRALGENAALLYQARRHARRSVELCPLHGEAYVLLANLSFLDPGPQPSGRQLAEQALRVRPRQSAVLFEIGRQRLVAGDIENAFDFWAQCSNNPGPHQLRIVQAMAGGWMPAAEYIRYFQPDWQTLREVWTRYKQRGRPEDLVNLAAYAQTVTEQKVSENDGTNPAYFWLSQAMLHNDLQQSQEALTCLEKAYSAGPHIYPVRMAIGRALLESERFAEAEPHVRWCLARRPDNKALSAALIEITKQRYARRSSGEPQ